jgi:hypothetical protein
VVGQVGEGDDQVQGGVVGRGDHHEVIGEVQPREAEGFNGVHQALPLRPPDAEHALDGDRSLDHGVSLRPSALDSAHVNLMPSSIGTDPG